MVVNSKLVAATPKAGLPKFSLAPRLTGDDRKIQETGYTAWSMFWKGAICKSVHLSIIP